MARKPAGYVGTNHETIGSDLLSVLQVVSLPDQVLGPKLSAQLKAVKSDAWYPISLMLETMNTLAERVGDNGLVQMGRQLFKLSHEERAKQMAKTAADIIFALDDMYHHANRGEQIGGWKPVKFVPGETVLHKNTPHHCKMEEGILGQALSAVNIPARVVQLECFRKGAPLCVYQLTSVISDERWMGGHPPVP